MDTSIIDLNQIGILARIVLAMVLGALIGLDRELASKPAGLRTHMLVSGAASLLVGLGGILMQASSLQNNDRLLQSDPIRIIEAVITGVSFLGAGTIIRNRDEGDVSGLTTAASLLFAAAVGISVALAQWTVAIGSTALVLLTLRVLPFFERRLIPKK